MSGHHYQYCLDANVLIVAWRTYYSPEFCPSYWELLKQFGGDDLIFIPKAVYEEIERTEDDLADWLKTSGIPIQPVDGNVTNCLKYIYGSNPVHKFLVDNTKQRSLADPWLIAHAMNSGACVVTKENLMTASNSNRIKIPNVCNNVGVRWIDDFEFIKELKINFSCNL